mmetsp:Transcript_18998/g.26817  ORF Transcript_18998/g.26817 Transcript_18998/m.26817 type:complete len:734 (+) Transcript_18998:149-2350(+)
MGCGPSKDDIDYVAIAQKAREQKQLQQQQLQYLTAAIESSSEHGLGSNHSPTEVNHPISPQNVAASDKDFYSIRLDATYLGKRHSGEHKYPHHLANIYAKPFELESGYQPPVFSKTTLETDFITKGMLKNFVFANLTGKESSTLVLAFEKITVSSGVSIINKGDDGDYFYLIESGTVRFEVNDKNVGQASSGDSFGELALLYTSPRAANCIAESKCDLWRLDQNTFKHILLSQTQETEKEKKDLLKKIPYFKDLDDEAFNKIASVMVPRQFPEGHYMFQKGSVAGATGAVDGFYIIEEGKVRLTNCEMGGRSCADQQLGPGDFFGENLILAEKPMIGDYHAKTDVTCFVIDHDTFASTVGSLESLVHKVQDRKKLAGIQHVQNTNLNPSELSNLAELIVEENFKAGTVIVEEGKRCPATLYLVRKGRIELKSSRFPEYCRILTKDGFFGEDQLLADNRGDTGKPIVKCKYTIEVLEDSQLGLLQLQQARDVIDTTRIGTDRPRKSSMVGTKAKHVKEFKRRQILGAGTFGQVWLASRINHAGKNEAFALKIQSKHELIQNGQARGVVQEMNIMSKLNHQFIIRLVATFQDPARVYLLLRLVQGGELFQLLHQEYNDGINEKDAKFYAAGILEALTYMHRRNIVYRDLKPENVLIDNEGYPVIIDLGFAKVVENKTYTLCGTPLYIAPEVILNRGRCLLRIGLPPNFVIFACNFFISLLLSFGTFCILYNYNRS